jgi:methanethiol S-methyltransferase
MFVLLASLVLVVLFLLWRPIPGVIWDVADPTGAAILWALFAIGWLTVLVSTFLISHFELFGLTQVWNHARGQSAPPPVFRTPMLYRVVRHPLYLGFILAFWATPRMTEGHLLLAIGMTVYMLIAIRYEERDLVGLFGRDYEDYRSRVGMLTPRLKRRT